MSSSSTMSVACDFCSERTAVLFCRADTAKLCLPCDQHVHSANLLSRKHVRSQICDNCSKEAVSVRCFTENLVLCQECDYDVHGSCSSTTHNRLAVEGFSGCPSVWGLDLEGKKKEEEEDELPLVTENFRVSLDTWGSGSNIVQDLIVPYDISIKSQSPSLGRYKQVVYKQLEELLKRGFVVGDDGGEDEGEAEEDGGGENMVPEGINGGGRVVEQSPTTSFTSLLMSTEYQSPNGNGMQWNATNPSSNQNTQIWDFNLGQSRNHEESCSVEAKSSTFTFNNLTNLKNVTRPTIVKAFKETYKEDSIFSTSTKGQETSKDNNLVAIHSQKDSNNSNDLHIAKTSNKTTRFSVATSADLEQMAQNRDNAMQRYKEKKKTRRYDKTIRYETRKARADTRLRVKGRFVKATDP